MVHMTLELSDGNQLLASDVFEEVEYKGVEGDAIRVSCADAADAERLFGGMSEGGTVLCLQARPIGPRCLACVAISSVLAG